MAKEREELLERYEATGDEDAFNQARRLFELAVAEQPDPTILRDYGYLLESHGAYEVRRATELYERAIELAPDDDKVRYQLINAKARLGETADAIEMYERELSASPAEVRWHRLLACAYLAAGKHEQTADVVERGLQLAPGDRTLTGFRGDVNASRGDIDGALADWRQALDPEGHDIGPGYSSAFLLEREGRYEEGMDAWTYILEFNASRGYSLKAEWPRDVSSSGSEPAEMATKPLCPLVLALLADRPRSMREQCHDPASSGFGATAIASTLDRLATAGLARRRNPGCGRVEFLITRRGRAELRLQQLIWLCLR